MTVKDILDTMMTGQFRIYNEDRDLLADSFFDADALKDRDVKTVAPANDGLIDITIKAKRKQHYTLHYVRSEEIYYGVDADSEEEATALFWMDINRGKIDMLDMTCIEENVCVEEVSDK